MRLAQIALSMQTLPPGSLPIPAVFIDRVCHRMIGKHRQAQARRSPEQCMEPRPVVVNKAIELVDVSLEREGRPVLVGVSLTLREPRIGIVGRNGSGKSTLLRVIAGLIEPDEGAVSVAGANVMRDRAAAIRAVGILFQNPDHQIIFPTVEEEVAFGIAQLGASRAEARRRAREVLVAHGREDWAARSTHTLSQGQRHYLCLMAILAMEPQAILLDEPFTGLDIPTKMQLNRSLSRLRQQVLMVTHDVSLLKDFDRILWLEEGKLCDDGPAAAVLERFAAAMHAQGETDPCWR
jgi:biotin transport system ATP-binding protein